MMREDEDGSVKGSPVRERHMNKHQLSGLPMTHMDVPKSPKVRQQQPPSPTRDTTNTNPPKNGDTSTTVPKDLEIQEHVSELPPVKSKRQSTFVSVLLHGGMFIVVFTLNVLFRLEYMYYMSPDALEDDSPRIYLTNAMYGEKLKQAFSTKPYRLSNNVEQIRNDLEAPPPPAAAAEEAAPPPPAEDAAPPPPAEEAAAVQPEDPKLLESVAAQFQAELSSVCAGRDLLDLETLSMPSIWTIVLSTSHDYVDFLLNWWYVG